MTLSERSKQIVLVFREKIEGKRRVVTPQQVQTKEYKTLRKTSANLAIRFLGVLE